MKKGVVKCDTLFVFLFALALKQTKPELSCVSFCEAVIHQDQVRQSLLVLGCTLWQRAGY